MKYKRFLLLGIMLIGLFIAFIPAVKGFDDIDYEFQRDILLDRPDVADDLELFNMRPQQVYNGTYPATYSFTDDTVGSNPLSWIVDESGGTVEVISEFSGHKKVMELLDNDNDGIVSATNNFDNQLSGTIDFWVSTSDATNELVILFQGSTNTIIIVIEDDLFKIHDGASQITVPASPTPLDNVWYHLSLDFETGGGSYEGLGVDEWQLKINGVQYGVWDLNNPDTHMGNVLIFTETLTLYTARFDGIGYSWITGDESFTFSSDTVGLEPIGWTSNNDASCTTEIIANLDGRSKVLELDDGNGAGQCNISTSITTDEIFNITFDFATSFVDDINQEAILLFMEDNVKIIDFNFTDVDLWYHNGISYQLLKAGLNVPNQFNEILLVLNNDLGTFDIFIDDVLEGSNLSYRNNITIGVNGIQLFTNFAGNPILAYIDNIFVNPSSYKFGGNFQPSLETLEGFEGMLEADKYEFSFLDVNTRAIPGVESFGVWNFDDSGEGFAEMASARMGTNVDLDREVSLLVGIGVGTASITRTALTITESLVDVNIGFISTFLGSTHGTFSVILESSDQTIISGWRVDYNTNDLSYWDGGWNVLRSDIAIDVFYDINIFLNYDLDVVRLEYIVEGVFITNYLYDMAVSGKTGLYEIFLDNNIGAAEGLNEIRVDYVGLYRGGESWHGELGVITLPLNEAYHFQAHYLNSLTATGRIHQGVVEGSYVGDETPFLSVKNISTISGVPKSGLNITNTGAFFWTNMSDATLVFTCVGSDISITSIAIEGSLLVEGSNEYLLEFTSAGLDSRDSYFYVSGDELRFTHKANQDGVLEFIQAEFNIVDETSTDTAVSFRSRIEANAFGFFRVSYANTSQLIQIENVAKTKRVLLTPSLTIDSFIVLVSDTNKDVVTGITTGFVSDITLLDIETSGVSIVSLNLIDIMIPIMLILIPTLLFSELYGKSLIIPIFLLMSLLLAITSIIPIWLFFVIGLSLSLFIFFQKDEVGF